MAALRKYPDEIRALCAWNRLALKSGRLAGNSTGMTGKD
jgi:hypothetical protein